jgi:hypothetical protein
VLPEKGNQTTSKNRDSQSSSTDVTQLQKEKVVLMQQKKAINKRLQEINATLIQETKERKKEVSCSNFFSS